jgi:hypothetical protein
MGNTVLDSRKGVSGVLINAQTNERIPFARWASIPDDPNAEGEFEALAVDQFGNKMVPARVYRGRCRLRFIPKAAPDLPRKIPVNTGTALTRLPPSSPAVQPQRRAVPVLMLRNRPCQHYACLRMAEWQVSEEVELAPITGTDGRLYDTAKHVRTWYYCSWHYKAPKLFDARGELICEHNVKARPN